MFWRKREREEKRVRWELGGEMQDLCREERREFFPTVRPLCASCQAVMLYCPTGGALEVEGLERLGRGGVSPPAVAAGTVTLR